MVYPIFVMVTLFPKYLSFEARYVFKFFAKPEFKKMKNLLFFLIVQISLLIISGTVEINPGPLETNIKNLSFAFWNLDSIPAKEYSRIPLIETLQATYNFNIFGVCESALNPDISNENVFIREFSQELFRADKPANTRNGEVCLYYNENLPIKRRPDLEMLWTKSNRKKNFFLLSYRHPNQSAEEFEHYINSLQNILRSHPT